MCECTPEYVCEDCRWLAFESGRLGVQFNNTNEVQQAMHESGRDTVVEQASFRAGIIVGRIEQGKE
jgi:hypothetical protein